MFCNDSIFICCRSPSTNLGSSEITLAFFVDFSASTQLGYRDNGRCGRSNRHFLPDQDEIRTPAISFNPRLKVLRKESRQIETEFSSILLEQF